MRRVVVVPGLCFAAQNHQLHVATRALRLPRQLSRGTSTAAFDGWMKRTITALYGAQLFINVVKGMAAVGAVLAGLYYLYLVQRRFDQSFEWMNGTTRAMGEAYDASSEAIRNTASSAHSTFLQGMDATKDTISAYGWSPTSADLSCSSASQFSTTATEMASSASTAAASAASATYGAMMDILSPPRA